MLRPVSPDEAGFLMKAAQWAEGTSLYGNFWVDRPPLLIMLFQLAHLAGGPIGLRLSEGLRPRHSLGTGSPRASRLSG